MKKLIFAVALCLVAWINGSAALAQSGEFGIVDARLRNPCPTDIRDMVGDWFRTQGLPFTVITGRRVNTLTRETVFASGVISVKLPFWDGRPIEIEIGVADKIVPTPVVVYLPNSPVNASIGSSADAVAQDIAEQSLQPYLRQRARSFTSPCSDSSAFPPVFGFDSQVTIPQQIVTSFGNLEACRAALRAFEELGFVGVQLQDLGGCNALASGSLQNSRTNIAQLEDGLRAQGYERKLSVRGEALSYQGWTRGNKGFIFALGAYQPDPRITILIWRSASFSPRGFSFDSAVPAPVDASRVDAASECVRRSAQLREKLPPPTNATRTEKGGCFVLQGNPKGVYAQTRSALSASGYEIIEDDSGTADDGKAAFITARKRDSAKGLELILQENGGDVLMTWFGLTLPNSNGTNSNGANNAATALGFDLSLRLSASFRVLTQGCDPFLTDLRAAIKLNPGTTFTKTGGCLIVSAAYVTTLTNLRQTMKAAGYNEEFAQIGDKESYLEFKKPGANTSVLMDLFPYTGAGQPETGMLWVGIDYGAGTAASNAPSNNTASSSTASSGAAPSSLGYGFEARLPIANGAVAYTEAQCAAGVNALVGAYPKRPNDTLSSSGCYAVPGSVASTSQMIASGLLGLGWSAYWNSPFADGINLGFYAGNAVTLLTVQNASSGYVFVYFARFETR